MLKAILSVMVVVCSFSVLKASEPSDRLIQALIKVEMKHDDFDIGDKHLVNKAYGPLQIRQPYMTDAMGKKHRAQECLGNRELSIRVVKKYMARYATVENLGHEPTDEDFARIHNGGPDGATKESTKAYWAKVQKALRQLDKEG